MEQAAVECGGRAIRISVEVPAHTTWLAAAAGAFRRDLLEAGSDQPYSPPSRWN